MEKFGIFELLDALSAVLEHETDAPPEGERVSPSTDDKAFAPPSYSGKGAALSSLLARHDALSKKIDRGDPPEK